MQQKVGALLEFHEDSESTRYLQSRKYWPGVTTPLRTIADVALGDPAGAQAALSDALDRGLVRRGQLERASLWYPHAGDVFGGVE